jgi:predicted nucleotide-binding protein (sugar kinase/HSP70/actin superfamily)
VITDRLLKVMSQQHGTMCINKGNKQGHVRRQQVGNTTCCTLQVATSSQAVGLVVLSGRPYHHVIA